MLILGIETSCDETSAAVVENGRLVRSCVIASSSKDFTEAGGVIPEQAAREQLKNILPVIGQSLKTAKVSSADLDAIAVTNAPGLLGSLLIGTSTARALGLAWNKPLIPVHHTLGHLSSTWLIESEPTADRDDEPQFPILSLSVSGGHSDLWLRRSHTDNTLLGSTKDDAAGEAFDKGATLLGLPYPGGPALAALAENGDEKSFPFPTMLEHDPSLDFSFSGLKTSLKYLLRDIRASGKMIDEPTRSSIAASYQLAICNHLIRRLRQAIDHSPDIKEIHLVGGVSANLRLRSMTEALGKAHRLVVRWPSSLRYCTDNGAMIAAAATSCLRERPDSLTQTFETAATSPLASAHVDDQ